MIARNYPYVNRCGFLSAHFVHCTGHEVIVCTNTNSYLNLVAKTDPSVEPPIQQPIII